jgi:hypothetical protein
MPMPTVVASSVVVLPDAKVPWANKNEPTVTSESVADASFFEYVVAEPTMIVAVAPLGPVTAMVSPLTAVTLPITDGCSMSMLEAVVEPAAVGVIRTCSPIARSAAVAATRSFVNVVEDVIVNMVAAPPGPVTVIEVEVTALTRPPAPPGQLGPASGVVAWAPTVATVLVPAVDEVIPADALATPAPVARAPIVIAAEMVARFITFFFVVRYMGEPF